MFDFALSGWIDMSHSYYVVHHMQPSVPKSLEGSENGIFHRIP
jgi:hypothetical protein